MLFSKLFSFAAIIHVTNAEWGNFLSENICSYILSTTNLVEMVERNILITTLKQMEYIDLYRVHCIAITITGLKFYARTSHVNGPLHLTEKVN